MTATGSHIDFGFAARSTTLQGKALVCASPKAPTAPHPSRLWRATFPQGKAFLCPSGLLHRICRSGIATRRAGHAHAPTVPRRGIYGKSIAFTPSVAPKGVTAPPTRREPYSEHPTAYRPSSGHPKGWPPSPRGRLFLSTGRPFSEYTNASAGNFPVEALLYFFGIFPTFQPLIPTPRYWTWARHRYSCCPRPEPARRRFPG